jgi:hypothetical protein
LADIVPNGDRGVAFAYGACAPGFDPEARVCGGPLSVQVVGASCELRVRRLRSMPSPTTARGCAVVQYARTSADGPLAEVFTGRVRVVVYHDDEDNPLDAAAIVQNLRGLGMAAAIGPGDPLPPPDPSDC